ncbi:MAG: methyltransferase domain-containing protein [Nocardiopsaceae bacterium]|jgi:SAM-dependent methyltransferase|nr:methyltransferase domain-containing protein [Nocardiopsaceae bacterium]
MNGQQDSPAPTEAEQAAAGNPVLSLDFYDAEMRRHNEHFRAAADVRPDERVLDIGCGTGQTTREAARSAVNGSALGVDISPRMLERARELTDAEGPSNASYQLGDAQRHPFPAAGFDLGISRFGTMFFADPVAAFTNIGGALRPEGRLMIMVWQAPGRNEWFTSNHQALAAGTAPVTAPPDAPDPFSLADPAATRDLLAAAGFAEFGFSDVHEPVYYGPDATAAYDVILSLRFANDLLAAQDAAGKQHALGRLRASLAERDAGGGVFFDSRAWIITARRR